MAAVVFGIEKPLHLKGLPWRQTESINSGVFEEEPYERGRFLLPLHASFL